MCFVCSQPEGFETDVSEIIRLGRNSNFQITRKESPQRSIPKIYLTVNSELNQKADEAKRNYEGNFSDYKFYNKGNDVYQIKTELGYEDITRKKILTFSGEQESSSFKEVSVISDIKETLDQVTGLDTDSGKLFRIYTASFNRLPDSDGLKYWIGKYKSDENNERSVASSFLASTEFSERYGSNVTDEEYVTTLYQNVLDRAPDANGLNYWLGQLTSGAETRSEALLGFAESTESKALFTEMTGFG